MPNFKAMQWFKLPISRLRGFTRSSDKPSYRILKQGHGLQMAAFILLWLVWIKFGTVSTKSNKGWHEADSSNWSYSICDSWSQFCHNIYLICFMPFPFAHHNLLWTVMDIVIWHIFVAVNNTLIHFRWRISTEVPCILVERWSPTLYDISLFKAWKDLPS